MRKVICIVTALLLCVSLAGTALGAALNLEFAPSISAKSAPKIGNTVVLSGPGMEDQDVSNCVVVTSVKEAQDKTTDITQEERDLLLEVYEELADGSMELPVKNGYAIRDLIDLSFKYDACRAIEEHNHKDVALKEEGVVLTVDFVLGVSKDTDMVVLTYIDGKWEEIEEVVVGNDGVVTCTFEDICPVAFCVRQAQAGVNPDTGDAVGTNMGMWIGVMAVCAVALVALVVVRSKKTK